jgi:hypothetical protein
MPRATGPVDRMCNLHIGYVPGGPLIEVRSIGALA